MQQQPLETMYRERADAARARGHVALRPPPPRTTLWSVFSGAVFRPAAAHQDYETAASHFKAAAGAYQMVKDWTAAAECLWMQAEALVQLGQPGLAAAAMYEAAHCGIRAGADPAPLLRLAADIYVSANRFDRAAKCVLELAADADEDVALQRQLYSEAVDMFEKCNNNDGGGDSLDCRHCRVKVAELTPSDAEAADMFERLGRYECVGDRCRRHGGASFLARKFFLQSLLCHLALGDVAQARRKQELFADLDCTFPRSRENVFVTQLIAAMDGGSLEAFANACADFDRVSPLDAWKTAVLLRAKGRIITAGVAEEEEDPDLR